MGYPNIDTDAYAQDPEDPPGFRAGALHLSPPGAELAVKAFELPPGEKLCPYHYEYVEEWLILGSGALTLRTPAGIEELVPGDVVRFPKGPDGAHQVTAHGDTPARFVMFSSAHEPSVAVYPDSDKVGVWSGDERDTFMFRRADGNVPYYDGEV